MTVIVQSDPKIIVAPSGVSGAQGPPGPAGSGSTIGVKDEGTLASAIVERINFTGAGVSVSGTGADVNVTIPGGLSVVTPQMFGGSPAASAATNNAAFQDALDYLESTAPAGAFNGYGDTNGTKGGGKLFIPRGVYQLSAALDIFSTVVIEGEGGFELGASATVLKWAAGTSGFRVQRYNTSGDGTYDAVDHGGGDGSIIRNLWLVGGYSGTEGEYHGVIAKARVLIENCELRLWQGDGIRIIALAGSHGASEGNANSWKVINTVATQCRNGLYLDGDNTNAGMSLGFNGSANRQWGIFDSSFLANTHLGFHLDSNGQNPNNMATYNSKVYAVIPGQEAWCSTNAPSGTTAHNQGWYYHDAGGVGAYGARAWTSGLTWRAGGPMMCDNPNAPHVFSGYVEGGQPPAHLEIPAMVLGNGCYGAINEYGTADAYSGILTVVTPGNAPAGMKAAGFWATTDVRADGVLTVGGGTATPTNYSNPVIYYHGMNGLSFWPRTTGGSSYDLTFYNRNGIGAMFVPHDSIDVQMERGILLKETAAASVPSPPAGYQTLFIDTDHILKLKNSSGTVTAI